MKQCFLLVFLTIFLFTGCEIGTNNSTDAHPNESGKATADTVTLAELQGRWVKIGGGGSFDSIAVSYSTSPTASGTVLEFTGDSVINYSYDTEGNGRYTSHISRSYYTDMTALMYNDTLHFLTESDRGSAYSYFIKHAGDVSLAYQDIVNQYDENFRFPTSFIGSWYETREFYESGWNDAGDIGGNKYDTSFASLEESGRLVVITADSVTNFRWDSDGTVSEEHFTHGQWAGESDWDNARTNSEGIIMDGADYEGYSDGDYYGFCFVATYASTPATTPPASWYSRPAILEW